MDGLRGRRRAAVVVVGLAVSAAAGAGSAVALVPDPGWEGSPASSVSHAARAAPAPASGRVQNSSVRVNGLRFRAQPSYRGAVRGLLYRGDRVQVIGWSGPWMHVRLAHRSAGGSRAGAVGWVAKTYLYGPSCTSYKSWPCSAWR